MSSIVVSSCFVVWDVLEVVSCRLQEMSAILLRVGVGRPENRSQRGRAKDRVTAYVTVRAINGL